MNGREIIKELMKEQEITQAELARILNITPATLWDRLNNKKRKGISLELFEEILNALGYEIEIKLKSK